MKLNLEWVTDTIGDKYKTWEKGDIVLLQAQTGTGKTNFIKNTLIDYLEDDQNLLYICNRTNLKRQLKRDLLKKFKLKVPKTNEELDKITKIKNITITSYHAIQYSVEKELYDGRACDLTRFNYVVADECHFFFDDSGYSSKTKFSFEKLVKTMNPEAITIFISATLEDIEQPIKNFQQKSCFGNRKPEIHRYKTGTDYSYVHTKYFKSIDNIINLIKNDKSDEKWMIFVSDLKLGYHVKKELKEGICSVIKSGTTSKELDSIIDKSKFKNKVLVTTKCLDNGVNINDPLLKNIIIMTWDRISFVQMLGRKRVDIEDADKINLYIPLRYKKSFDNKIYHYNKKFKEIDLLRTDPNKFNEKYDNALNEFSDLYTLFYRDKVTKEYKINAIGLTKLEKDKKFAKFMVDKFDNQGKFAYVIQQLDWIGLQHTFDEFNLIEDVLIDEEVISADKYFADIDGKKLFIEQQKEVANFIISKLSGIKEKFRLRGITLKWDTLEKIIRNELKLEYAVSKPKREQSKNSQNVNKNYIVISKIQS